MGDSSRRRLVVIGAAGGMVSVTVKALAKHEPRWEFVLCDLQEEALQALANEVRRTSPAETLVLDMFDVPRLRKAISGADFVLLGAGPFHRTAGVVRRACLEERVACLDIDDDVESSQDALTLDGDARLRGVPLYAGCGASPGFTNVLARDCISRLEEAESVEVAWCVGDEGPQQMGRAVVEHTMHIAAGPCLTWRDAAPFMTRTFEASRVVAFAEPLGNHRVYEVAHPETVHLPHTYPHLRSVVCWGGLDPAPLNGIIRGIALGAVEGRLSHAEACDFMQAIMRDDFGSWKGWREAWRGMRGQNRRGEVPLRETLQFLAQALRGKHVPTRGGIAAIAVGRAGGVRVEVSRTAAPTRAGNFWHLMSTSTGISAAAFLSLAADDTPARRSGTLFPEAWTDPQAFYGRCASFGFQVSEIVNPVVTRELDRSSQNGARPVSAQP